MGRLSFFLFAVAVCQAQSLSFDLAVPGDTTPTARYDGATAYDSVGKRIFVFGGQDSASRNDLWSYSPADAKWTQIQAAGQIPPARFGHTLVFDSLRHRLILFGGQSGYFFSDVWAFDIAAGRWNQLGPDGAGPSQRYGHSAIYDSSRDRMVISHGFTTAGRFDDTWVFDLKTNTWRDISPTGTRPLRRCLHHAAYDQANDRMYLYGGCSSGYGPCPQGDLWAFDLAAGQWTELTPQVSPAPREHYGMAFDSGRKKLVVFGGNGNTLFNDTWEYDPATKTWLPSALADAPPSARQRHEAAYDSDGGRIFFFGGLTGDGATNELWSLGVGPALSVGDVFSGDGKSVAPGEIVSIYGAALGPASGIATQRDPQTGNLPTVLNAVSATWNGTPAPILYSQAGQLNVQAPYELAGAQSAMLAVTTKGAATAHLTVPVTPTHPGAVQAAWNQDGTVNSPGNPAAVGSVVTLFVTGQGVTSPASATGVFANGVYPEPVAETGVQIGGLDAAILFRGQAPGTIGLMQLNVVVPNGVQSGIKIAVAIRIGGVAAPAGLSIAIV